MAASLLQRAQQRISWLSQKLSWLPPSVARITVGWVFLQSGWGKLHDLDTVVGFFRELGIPAPELQASFVSGLELVGGALLMVGLGTRLAALPLMGTMAVAIATARWKEFGELGDLFGFIEWLYLALLLYLAVDGPGALSLDRAVAQWAARASQVTRTPPGRS